MFQALRRIALLIGIAGGSIPAHADVLPYLPQQGEAWSFDILLGERDVGDVDMSFAYSDDGLLSVVSETEAKIKLAFITVFQMKSESIEIWDGTSLQKLAFTSDMNGDDQWGLLERQPDGTLLSQGPNGTMHIDEDLTHLVGWTTISQGQSRFVRPLENDVINIDLVSSGFEQIAADGTIIEAELFDLPADENGNKTNIWFDREGRWARTELVTPQATLIFQRRSITRN